MTINISWIFRFKLYRIRCNFYGKCRNYLLLFPTFEHDIDLKRPFVPIVEQIPQGNFLFQCNAIHLLISNTFLTYSIINIYIYIYIIPGPFLVSKNKHHCWISTLFQLLNLHFLICFKIKSYGQIFWRYHLP